MIHSERDNFSVSRMCRLLEVSPAGYYAWIKREPSAHEKTDALLTAKVKEVFVKYRHRYGSPRVHAELEAQGLAVGRKRIERLMRENDLAAKRPKPFKKTTDSNHALPIAPNVLDREFEVTGPNQAWVADISYVRTLEGWLFLAVIVDLFARRVVGWAIADHMRTELPLAALEMAIRLRGPACGLVHHSDRGVQYASEAYRTVQAAHGMVSSMSRKGDCWDNAVAESFFGRMKVELGSDIIWATKAEGQAEVGEYIDVFYNCQRRHSHNEYLTPVEAELVASQLAPAA